MEFVAIWLLLAVVVAIAARARGRNGFAFFFLAVIVSPLIGLLILLAFPNLRHERLLLKIAGRQEKNIPFEPEGMYGDIPYRVTRNGAVEALMQGSVVRFKSADHMFNALGGEPPPSADAPALPQHSPRRGRVSALAKLVLLLGVAGGIAFYAFKLKNDQHVAAGNVQLAEAAALASSTEVNGQWEATFDKTGKYPEGQNSDSHNAAYGAALRIPADSPSFADARALVDKFATRQLKINAIERAKKPPEPENPKIKLGKLDKSYNLIKGSFTIENPNAFAIADVKIACSIMGESGTTISELSFVIYEIVPAKGRKVIQAHDFGYASSQTKSISCNSAGYVRR